MAPHFAKSEIIRLFSDTIAGSIRHRTSSITSRDGYKGYPVNITFEKINISDSINIKNIAHKLFENRSDIPFSLVISITKKTTNEKESIISELILTNPDKSANIIEK